MKAPGKSKFSTIESAVKDIKNGKMIIVVDDPNRENEGDLVLFCAESDSSDDQLYDKIRKRACLRTGKRRKTR